MYRLLASHAQCIFVVCFLEGIFLSFFICLFVLLTEGKKNEKQILVVLPNLWKFLNLGGVSFF